ncbi:MAG: hypothetical protein V1928_00145 [Parcubacteria group bacterium]
MDASISNICMAEWANNKKQQLQKERGHEITHLEFSRYLGIPAQTVKDWQNRPDYTFGGLRPRNKEKLRKLFPNEFGPAALQEVQPENPEADPLIMPILENDYRQKGLAKYTYALQVLNMPLATFQKWTKMNYKFSQLSEKYQSRLAELLPDKFKMPAGQDSSTPPVQQKAAIAARKAPMKAVSTAIIVQYEISKLVSLLESFVKGTEEDRKALRRMFKDNEWYNFMNLVQALSSEKARENALLEKRVQLTDEK